MISETENDVLVQISEWNLKLKKQLKTLEKMRIAYANLQLEFTKLYSPRCLEIFETLKRVTGDANDLCAHTVGSNRLNERQFAEMSARAMEMQNSMTDPTPVLSRPMVVTAQPQGDVSQARRPIPVNTSDWVSTPRSQLSALSGSHFLGNVEQLEIQQIVDLSTLLGRSEKKFQYRVKIPRAETLFLAMRAKTDEPAGWNCSKLFRDDFALNVLDQCGETAFVMRMSSSRTFTLSKLHTMIVGSAKMLGSVEENFYVMGSSFTVYDETRKPLANIYGPNVSGCCMYQEALFQVISIDGTHQIASLMHQWDNVLHDYNLLITFPANTDVKFKSLLLGAAFLLEHMYFEELKRPS